MHGNDSKRSSLRAPTEEIVQDGFTVSAGLLLPVALKDGLPVLISEIPVEDIGNQCGCVCPNCCGPLVAKVGPYRRHHFAHTSIDCSFRIQDATRIGLLHIARAILQQEKKLRLPGYDVYDDRVESFSKDPEIFFRLTRRFQVVRPEMVAVLDVRLEKVTPDADLILVVETETNRIVMDVSVTSKASRRLQDVLPCGTHSAFELDLSKARYSDWTDRDRLRTIIVHDTQNKRWLHDPRFINAPLELCLANDKVVHEIRERRKAP